MTPRYHLTLAVIPRVFVVVPGVFVVATEVEVSDLIVPTIIDRVTFETSVINYMVVHLALLM